MSDDNANARVRLQRERRLREGWKDVRVWVPSEQDAKKIRNLAEELRRNAEQLYGLSERIETVNMETQYRIAEAIAQQGSKAYNTPSGAVLSLMTQLAEEDDLEGFAIAVNMLARASPANARYVSNAIPPKISNYLILQRSVDRDAFFRWMIANPTWSTTLKEAVRNPPQFMAVIEDMIEQIEAKSNRH